MTSPDHAPTDSEVTLRVEAPARLAGYLSTPGQEAVSLAQDETISLLWREPGAELSLESWHVGDLDMVEFVSDGAVDVAPVLRPAPGSSTWPGLTVGVCLEGRVTLTQSSRTVHLEPGRLAFYNGGRPFRISTDGPHRWLVCRLRFLRQGSTTDAAADVAAREIPLADAAGGMLADLLVSVARARGTLSPRARVHCADAVHSLVRAVMEDVAGSLRSRKAASSFTRYTQWLEEHLTDDDATAEQLAAAHHVSVRQVRGVFAAHGTTVSTFVRQLRLESFKHDLLDLSLLDHTVAALARRSGLRDPAVASRLFRAQYGLPPGTYRRGALNSALS
ncbi:AraC-type DNA-binding protein [Quadrisphaera granulorum]|uniref:AraC-like DNA-binding protein n=1 Tax=Quadrisphaera granulorum TaxID=317664 RepID=A0A315ZTS4_9ACTN|nr:AraC family transcriptional regulator [Quadrisphaera granulorum]PWJ48288.1 AraC-like DNA-binding protein [Quadrisphaera granulorum]SZE98449.1 AraC-type DNA-binding protein [Quadrisphaera granulorum]